MLLCTKKYTIFVQLFWNFVKMFIQWIKSDGKRSAWLDKNCGFFINSILFFWIWSMVTVCFDEQKWKVGIFHFMKLRIWILQLAEWIIFHKSWNINLVCEISCKLGSGNTFSCVIYLKSKPFITVAFC